VSDLELDAEAAGTFAAPHKQVSLLPLLEEQVIVARSLKAQFVDGSLDFFTHADYSVFCCTVLLRDQY